MNTYLKKDIEETRALEKEAHKRTMDEAELLCVALIHTAADGKISDMMTLLDMVAARVILEASEQLKISVDSITELHTQHIVKTIKVLKGRM